MKNGYLRRREMIKFLVDLALATIGAAIIATPLIIYFWEMKP